jgi:hypothetical protein
MKRCNACGSAVTDDYHRVFSDNYGTLHRCRYCDYADKDSIVGVANGYSDMK